MAKTAYKLGKVQFRLMQVLWQEGTATARQITEKLNQIQPIAHSTVQTLLRELEAKGAVAHDVEDRTFVYRPLYEESRVTRRATEDFLSRVFNGSVYGLVAHLLKHEELSPEELSRLRQLINQGEQQ